MMFIPLPTCQTSSKKATRFTLSFITKSDIKWGVFVWQFFQVKVFPQGCCPHDSPIETSHCWTIPQPAARWWQNIPVRMVARFQLDVHGWEIPAPKGRAFNGKSIELHTFPAMPCLMSLMTPELFLSVAPWNTDGWIFGPGSSCAWVGRNAFFLWKWWDKSQDRMVYYHFSHVDCNFVCQPSGAGWSPGYCYFNQTGFWVAPMPAEPDFLQSAIGGILTLRDLPAPKGAGYPSPYRGLHTGGLDQNGRSGGMCSVYILPIFIDILHR